jgi:hypothetical protein
VTTLIIKERKDFVYWFSIMHQKNPFPCTLEINDGKTDVVEVSSVGKTAPTPPSNKSI